MQNDRQSWEELLQAFMDRSVKSAEIDVALGPDVTNLRYLFPIAVWLRANNRISAKTPMKVNLQSEGSENIPGDLKRVERFLAGLMDYPGLSFTFNGAPLQKTDWSPSRIFPICQVSEQAIPEEHSADYRQLRRSVCWNAGERDTVSPDLIPILNAADAFLTYVDSPSNYSGTQDSHISSKFKKALCRELREKMEPFRREMDVLSQVIWLFLLRELLETKQLYSIPESKEDSPRLYEEVFAKSRMDAVSYGEALYQLIENACIHSAGHRAWFGFRMYRAGRDVPMSLLLEETETRKRLYDKYCLCFSTYDSKNAKYTPRTDSIFAGQARYFFEFFVLDGAWDQAGILDNYNVQKITRATQKLDRRDPKRETESQKKRWARLWQSAFEELKSQPGALLQSVKELIHLLPQNETPEEHIENVTVHYGLRLLWRIVSVNGGYLVNHTPLKAGGSLHYYHDADLPDNLISGESSHMTEWTALLPISYHWQPMGDALPKDFETDSCFQRRIPLPRQTVHYLNCGKLFREADMSQPKTDLIRALAGQLYRQLPWAQSDELSSSILLLHIDSPQLYQLELFAKALFSCIAQSAAAARGAEVRIAVLLPTADTLHELLRLFSTFYPEGRTKDMENVQVAFCSRSKENKLLRVNFILAGSSLSNAFEAAKLFAYHHSEDSLEHLSLLDYLTNRVTGAYPLREREKVPPLFPFDLFLPSRLPEQDDAQIPIHPWKDSWFLAYIAFRLNLDIRAPGNGCMIDNIHARLGSKLHLSRFFEGELLFHDTGNVLRFAYLLAQELLYGEDALTPERHIVLLGYEKYSVSLMLHLEDWLKQSDRFSAVHTAIVHDGEDDGDVEVRPCYDEDQASPDNSIQVVTVMPVGTTLSTVYKMYHAARRSLKLLPKEESSIPLEQTKNFCLVLVNQDLFQNNMSEVTKRYWHTVGWEDQHVTTCEEVNGGKRQKVRYLLPANAKWLAPDECSICRLGGADTRAIIDAKNSNTMLSSIFTLWSRREGRFEDLVPGGQGGLPDNQRRLRDLLGNILYSHIYDGNNHFQFYLNFSDLYYKHQAEIDREVASWTVPMDAFHVVVSPLHFTNSPFLKSVLERVFHGSARFLHIDLKDSYREEIRMKFIYIAEDFKRMRRISPNTKFCVHFVDTSIVTGSSLNRAKLMMRMLLQQVKCSDENVELFSKVFLLVNRCSYATVQSFVRDPQKDLRAYIYLAIPSYNTENDFCPACRLVNRYKLLEKRSATERLSNEFRRLRKKHKKRKRQEYEEWLKKDILRSPSYFNWLRQWLYVNVPENAGRVVSFITQEEYDPVVIPRASRPGEYKKAREVAKQIESYIRDTVPSDGSQQEILTALSDVTLEQVAANIQNGDDEEKRRKASRKFKKRVRKIVRTYLLDKRSYMRLYSMQRAYQELESMNGKLDCGSYPRELDRLTRTTMLDLISSALKQPETIQDLQDLSPRQAELARFMCRLEWLISYIKVLSREQIAKYYHCRRAIMGIMDDMLKLLFVRNEGNDLAQNEQKRERMAAGLVNSDLNWAPIIDILTRLSAEPNPDEQAFDVQLRAQLEYQLTMTLLHRTADLQMGFVSQSDHIAGFLRRYYQLVDRCFSARDGSSTVPRFAPPSYDKVIRRYLKSMKAAVMTSEDDTPCLALTAIPGDLLQKNFRGLSREQTAVKDLFARYIYLENSRMLYSGMRDLEEKLPEEALERADGVRPADHFGARMKVLSGAVDDCLRSCYAKLGGEARKEDILYQNILGNFCRFWHKTSLLPPVRPKSDEPDAPLNPIAYLLQYFRRVNRLFKEKERSFDLDQRPYQYEELCHVMGGLTGYSMCYIAFRGKGVPPQIFTQSGFHVETMRRDQILTASDLDQLLHQMDEIRNSAQHSLLGTDLNSKVQDANSGQGKMLIPGVTRLWTDKEEFLIIVIGLRQGPLKEEKFCVVMQRERDLNTPADADRLDHEALENARNILFMRRRLQAILSRDYTVLLNFRFDYSYVRPLSGTPDSRPCLIHISDLHVKEDLTQGDISKADQIIEKLDSNLTELGRPVDLLAITGDIVDGREANAPQMDANYQYAEALLTRIAIRLWQDEDGYLPHDWRKRVMITTGNHDYAAMNQFKAIVKRRALASGLPVEAESSTMSKFAYYIDFLIRYLDAPVNDLIANDLNEIRYYRMLNVKVLMLNCSGTAVPRRTNKMGVNSEKVRNLLARRSWVDSTDRKDIFRLCLSHYSPSYELSYFLDDYDVLPGWDWSPASSSFCGINQLVDLFCRSVRHLMHVRYSVPVADPKDKTAAKTADQAEEEPPVYAEDKPHAEFLEKFRSLEQALEALHHGQRPANGKAGQFYNHLKALADARTADGASDTEQLAADRKVVSDMHKNELYQQIQNYYSWLMDKGRSLNQEQISHLVYEIQENLSMSQYDMKCFQELMKEVKQLDLTLSGHIHSYAEDTENHILVADKFFYDKSSDIRGYFITLGDDKATPRYSSQRFT